VAAPKKKECVGIQTQTNKCTRTHARTRTHISMHLSIHSDLHPNDDPAGKKPGRRKHTNGQPSGPQKWPDRNRTNAGGIDSWGVILNTVPHTQTTASNRTGNGYRGPSFRGDPKTKKLKRGEIGFGCRGDRPQKGVTDLRREKV